MLYNLYKYLVSGVSFLIFTSAFSQTHYFKNITTKDGLASSECYKIIQDKQGYIWISTDAGLCKYNGNQFQTFTTTDGLPTNTIFEIMEDKYGRIWGGGFHGGIFYIENDKVHNIDANTYLTAEGNKNKELIRKIILDDKDVLHVGTTKNYYKIYPENNYGRLEDYPEEDTSFTLLKTINNDLLFSRIISLKSKSDSYTKHYIITNGKKYQLYPSYDLRQALVPNYFACLTPNREIIFSLGNKLFCYNYYKLIIRSYNNDINCLYYDKDENLWIGFARQGYNVYPKGNLDIPPISGLHQNSVAGFFEDNEGGLWINTLNKGIFYSPKIDILSYPELNDQNIPAISVLNEQLYISNSNHQIYTIKNNKLEWLLSQEQQAHSERIFFSNINGNMYRSGGKSIKFNTSGLFETFNYRSYHTAAIFNQLIEGADSLWGINHEELLGIAGQNVLSAHKLPSRGFCLYQSNLNELLVGCMNGLYEYKKDHFIKIPIIHKNENIRISYITENKSGDLLLSTRGMGVFIRKKNRWININQSHGLASDLCNHIYCSADSTYYISTNKGISVIKQTGNSLKIENINISNGIPANEVNMVTEYDNRIYLATENGICSYPTNSKIFNITQPFLTVKSISITGDPLINNTEYKHNQNDLFFSVDVLSFQSPKENKVKYQLIPTDKNAKYSHEYKIHYDNLPPGDYTLTIQAVNNNGTEGTPTTYHFTICEAFWTTWWFTSFAVITILFISGFTVRKRINYLRKKENEKNLLKEKIVEFHYTALRAQMNPHFIFNVINSIQLYVLKNQPKEAYNYLSKFSKLIRRVLENSKEKLITLYDELETLNLYMELERIRLDGNVEFSTRINDSVEIEKLLVPSMIIQPILENSIWHGIVPLNGLRSGKIILYIHIEEESLIIKIRDNGIGIDPDKIKSHESFGLNLIRDRLSLLHGTTSIEIANLLDEKNNIGGAEVTIQLPLIRDNR
jgi:hypothetical protein